MVVSKGDPQTVGFSRPVTISLFIAITAQTLSDFPTDGEDQVLLAVLEKANTIQAGENVVAFSLTQNVEVLGLGTFSILVGRTSTPTNAIEPMTSREQAVFDSTRVSRSFTAI